MDNGSFLTIGKISGVHGLAGNLKVWSYADSPDTFAKGRKIILRSEGETGGGETFTIVKSSPRKKGILLVLKEVTDRNGSDALVGKEILINRDELPELEDDTWYWDDLTGLEVIDHKLGSLGKIKGLFSTAGDDIMVVQQGKTEILIPMNRHFVDKVDLEGGKLTTTLPEGFITD
jgi:16S rRNA processing protein RimM